MDRFRHLLFRSNEDLLPSREPAAERGVGPVAVAVGRVLGKNGPDEEIKGIAALAFTYEPERLTESACYLDQQQPAIPGPNHGHEHRKWKACGQGNRAAP